LLLTNPPFILAGTIFDNLHHSGTLEITGKFGFPVHSRSSREIDQKESIDVEKLMKGSIVLFLLRLIALQLVKLQPD